MENALKGFKGRFKQKEERISKLEDRTIEMIESETEKRLKESEQKLRDLWGIIKQTYTLSQKEERERERGRETM